VEIGTLHLGDLEHLLGEGIILAHGGA